MGDGMGDFNPFAGMPNYTGYERPKKAQRVIPREIPYSDEELEFIFTPPPIYSLEDHFAAAALDFLRRAVNANTLAEFLAYRRAYRTLDRTLQACGYWPEEAPE